ncbi:MAG: hypothetical protein RJB01_158 [Actinomycetota bacterium]
MDRSRFQEYIDRFNNQDATAFEDFLSPAMHMTNGTLEFTGVEGMKSHYAKIWSTFSEVLAVGRYVTDGTHIAIEMDTHFEAFRDDANSTFGPVTAGECFDFSGIIMYDLDANGRFAKIRVAYNRFTRTLPDGAIQELGIPH